MAKKTKKALPKERNPFTVQMVNRQGGGAHGKPHKTKRAQEKAKLKVNHESDSLF